ncbi:MAG: leucine-rich repeat protein [Lachnospiraceae bacterium]|nr:leucine-rich repeat protein [Lachnospiraceae bacterium]
MKKNYVKGMLAGLLSASMIIGSIPAMGSLEVVKADEVSLPQPAYEYKFEEVSGTTVSNTGTVADANATMGGNAPAIVDDAERGSKVLSLPGGSVGAGYLTLPESLFSEAENGFTISFWVKADTSAHYARLFEASNNELGAEYQGQTGNWTDPEFTLVVGGNDSTSNRYDIAIKPTSGDKARVEAGTALGSSEWSYITTSVTADSLSIYKNGRSVTATDLTSNLSSTLTKFLSEADAFKYAALGQSVYTSDNDVKASFDDFRFYNAALTEEQALAIYTSEYGQVIEETDGYESEPTLKFDMNKQTTDMFHGSTGFLYGISEVNVPSTDLVTGIAPKMVVQKAKDGKQHPSGDASRLANYLTDAGLESLQVYLQDYYLEWPYDTAGINDYKQKVEMIVTNMTEGKTEEEKAMYSYVLFNEPDGIWYNPMGSNINTFCNDWLTIYQTVKAIDPNAKTAGPNFSVYNKGFYDTFFKFCQKNNCLPEIITWHDLQKDKLSYFATEYAQIQTMVDTYYAGSDIEPMLFVNETANFEDVGAPGPLVNWLSIYEEKDVYASLPYWGLANSLNELAATANKPNGGWWVYRWYAQMQGKKVEMSRENISSPSSANKGDTLYGLTSIDDANRTVYSLFGGHEGTQVIRLKNLKAQEAFKDAKSAHVKIYQSKYTGHQGFAYETPVVFEGNVAFNNAGTLSLIMEDCDLLDAYFAVITPSDSVETAETTAYTRNWTATYEAEEGTLLGNATKNTRTGGGDLARSNRGDVTNILCENDGVEYTVTVPENGVYEAQVYYSVAAPYVNAVTLEEDASGQNRAIGRVVQNKLTVDGEEEHILNFRSTVKLGYFNYESVALNLTAGTHTITVTHYGADQTNVASTIRKIAAQDKLDLVYSGATEEKAVAAEVQFEELSAEGYTFGMEKAGYQDGGYKEGKGEMKVNVVVREDGYYDTTLVYEAAEAGNMNIGKVAFDYGKDAKADTKVGTYTLSLADIAVTADAGNFKEAKVGKIYLTAGANTIVVNSDAVVALDAISFVKDDTATESATLKIEAEAGELSGDAAAMETTQASYGEVVDGIGGGNADNTLTMKVNVKEAGKYKLSMFYTNDEPAPIMKDSSGNNYVHPYNTDLVERYAQIVVNGAEAETVYFRNTNSWEVFENVIMDVELKAGENTISFSNDNSYKFSEVVDDYAPRFDKFEIAPAMLASDYVEVVDGYTVYKVLTEVVTLKESNYTAASYKEFAAAKAALEALSESGSEAEIIAAIDNMKAKEAALVSYAPLKQQIALAGNVVEADYTRRSYKVLKAKLEAANAVLTNENATAADIETAIAELAKAKAALVLKQAPIDNSTGTITSSSSNAGTHAEYAWDGDASTYPDLLTADGGWDSGASWTKIEFEEEQTIVKIAYAGRSGYLDRLEGGIFYSSEDGKTWDKLYTIKSALDGYQTIELEEPVTCRFIRYNAPANAYLNIADIVLYVQSEDDPEEIPDNNNDDNNNNNNDNNNNNSDIKDPSGDNSIITPVPSPNPGAGEKEDPLAQYVGKALVAKNIAYKVTACTDKLKTVTVTGVKSKKTKLKSITIPDSITYDGIKFKVTEISKNAFKNQTKATKVIIGKNITKINASAFYGCKKLKTITIKGKAVKSIGKNAFAKIKKNAAFKVPKAKKSAYKKLLKNAKTKNYKVK